MTNKYLSIGTFSVQKHNRRMIDKGANAEAPDSAIVWRPDADDHRAAGILPGQLAVGAVEAHGAHRLLVERSAKNRQSFFIDMQSDNR